MTKPSLEVFVNQLFAFRDFLLENVGDISIVLALVFVSLVVLLFATREIVTWLSRTGTLKEAIVSLSKEVRELRSDIHRLEMQASTPAAIASKDPSPTDVRNQFLVKGSSEKEKPSFPIN